MLTQIFEATRTAMRAIYSYRLRTLLTTLGISIGIFSITIVFTLVNSMEYSISRNLSALGNTVLFVHHWPWKDNSEDWYKYFNRPKMRYADFQKLKYNLDNVLGVSFQARKGGVTLKTRSRSLENVTIRGVTYDYQVVNDFTYQSGRFFTPIEAEAGRHVCVIGVNIARNLFRSPPYTGKTIQVRGRFLRVVGVFERQGNNLFGDSWDDFVLIPYPVIARMYNVSKRSIDKVIAVKARQYEELPQVEGQVIGLMRASRGLKPGAEDNFSINKQETLMEQLGQLFEYINIGGIFISAFSLLIGGFGIFNIMFVSVRERTKEIGIQKALGATKSFILTQFLVEAVVLCLLGGLIGLLIFFFFTGLAQWLLNQTDLGFVIVISFTSLFTGIILSVLIGVFAGLLPSVVAASLDPVDAMRSK